MIYNILSKLPNYVRSFGLFKGISLMFAVEGEFPRKSQTIRKYNASVDGYSFPVYLRDSTGDHATFFQCLVMRQYELSQFKHFLRLKERYISCSKDGEKTLIIDCGANVGLGTIWFAQKFPNSIVVAVEPDKSNYELLCKNTEAFGKRVIALHGAVWHRPSTLIIANPDAGSASFEVIEVETNTQNGIRGYSIEEVKNIAESKEIFIMKIDIEGSQKALFSQNTNWVSKTSLIILELEDWKYPWLGTSRPFFSCLSHYPFEYHIKGENIFCFQDFETGSTN